MRITLKQLTVFDVVARTGSVRRAADEIAVSQSAASISLRDFEAHLGVALFERRGRRLVLNEHGRRLMPRVHGLLAQAREIELARDDDQLRGTLRIGAATSLGTYVLPPLLGAFLRQHPEVNVELSVLRSTEVIGLVEDMVLDCGFIDSPCNRAGIAVTPWREDRLAIFAAPDHPLAARQRLGLADLKDAAWVLPPAGSATRSTVTTAILGQLPNIRIALTTPNQEAIKRTVAAGGSIGCMSRNALAGEFRSGALKELAVEGMALDRMTSIIARSDAYESAACRAFLDYARLPSGDAARAPTRRRRGSQAAALPARTA